MNRAPRCTTSSREPRTTASERRSSTGRLQSTGDYAVDLRLEKATDFAGDAARTVAFPPAIMERCGRGSGTQMTAVERYRIP